MVRISPKKTPEGTVILTPTLLFGGRIPFREQVPFEGDSSSDPLNEPPPWSYADIAGRCLLSGRDSPAIIPVPVPPVLSPGLR